MENTESNTSPPERRNYVAEIPWITALRNAMITLLILNVMAQFLPHAPQWITDNGNKYIVMRNIAVTGAPAIRHPAPEFFPTGGFHFVRHRGKIRSFYPEYYPVLASKWWNLVGDRGLVWLSMFGSSAAVALLTLILGKRRGLTPFLLVFATPMFFFSFLLWEMTWSVFTALAAYALVQKKRYFLAGSLLGASLLLREEAYFFAFALTVELALRWDFKGAVKLLFGMAVLTLPIWVYQYFEFGHIFGLHGGNYYANNRAAGKIPLADTIKGVTWNYYHHLFRFDAFASGSKFRFLNRLCVIPAMLAIVSGAFISRRWDKLKLTVGIAATTGWLVLTIAYLVRGQDNEAYAAAMITGAIGSNPLFLPFYLNWRRALQSRSDAVHDAAVTACVYLLVVPPFLTRNDIGLIYGARHFLCIMPLLLLVGVPFIRRTIFHRFIFPAAIAAALLLQYGAFAALSNVAAEVADFENIICDMPEKTVVTDIFFIPEQTPHLFFEKDVFQLETAAPLLERLRRNGRQDLILLLSADPRFRRVSNEELAILFDFAEPICPPEHFKRNRGSGIMDIHIVRCRLK